MSTAAISPDVAPNVSYDMSDYYLSPDYTPVVPDASTLDLPGQFDSMPGGFSNNGSSYVADASGQNMVYADPRVNPTPTGGWQSIAGTIAAVAAQGMKAYSSGSPSPSIPAARRPVQLTPSFLQTPGGTTNWTLIGGVVVVGVVGLFVLGVL